MALPNFIGIGGQRAGSTWLYHALSAHPRIWMTPRKEIHYFDRSSGWKDPKLHQMRQKHMAQRMGRSRLEVWLWFRRYARMPRDDRWYKALFRPGRGQISGEVTPDYYVMDEERVAHVHDFLPEAKLLFSMRNPIERTWSHALLDLKRKGLNPEEMSAADVREWFDRGYVRKRSEYPRALERWSGFYPKERFFIIFMEDIHFHTFDLCSEIYQFLGVNPKVAPERLLKKINARSQGSMPAWAAKHLALSYHESLQSLSESFGGYASFWLFCAQRLIEGNLDDEERVSVPMWNSPLWKEWLKGQKPRFQSGPLAHLGHIAR